MKNTLRQVVVALTILATIVINILADALPINGLNTGKILTSSCGSCGVRGSRKNTGFRLLKRQWDFQTNN